MPLARATITGFVADLGADAITVGGIRTLAEPPQGLRVHDAVSVRAVFDPQQGAWHAEALHAIRNPLSPQSGGPSPLRASSVVQPPAGAGNSAPAAQPPGGATSRSQRFGAKAAPRSGTLQAATDGGPDRGHSRPPFNHSDSQVKV